MNQYLKKYDASIKVLSPIYIGSGKALLKKEYIFDNRKNQIMIPEPSKLYQKMEQLRMAGPFQKEFLLNPREKDLGRWIRNNRIIISDLTDTFAYVLDASDVILYKPGSSDYNVKGIDCFVRDAYNLPYVPGSSLKGMLRTALLSWKIDKHPEHFQGERKTIEITNPDYRSVRNGRADRKYLERDAKGLEQKTFHKRKLIDEKGREVDSRNAVNSIMAGIKISDSRPLKISDITACQKVDVGVDGAEHELPILREALKPGTIVQFTITIDEQICPYTVDDICDALKCQNALINRYFYSKYNRTSPYEDTVWLGGGVGFHSKTVIEALFNEKNLDMSQQIMKYTQGEKIYKQHKHYNDKGIGVSPHMCKCTRYKGNLCNMGMGRFQIL